VPSAVREHCPHPGKKVSISSVPPYVRGASTTSAPLAAGGSGDSRVGIAATPSFQIKEPGETAAALPQ